MEYSIFDSLKLLSIFRLVVIKDYDSAFGNVTSIYTLIKQTVSLATFNLNLLLWKPAFFIDNQGFKDGKLIVSKFMPELRILNLLRDSASFSRLTFRANYSDFNW